MNFNLLRVSVVEEATGSNGSIKLLCLWLSNKSSSKSQATKRLPQRPRPQRITHKSVCDRHNWGGTPARSAMHLLYACIYFAVSVPLITTWPRRPCAIPDYSNCVDSPAPWKCHSEYIICSNGLKTMFEVCSIPGSRARVLTWGWSLVRVFLQVKEHRSNTVLRPTSAV